MAHNLYQNKYGSYAYVGRQSAWHSLGTVTGKYQTWQDILAANDGAMDYEVLKRQQRHFATGEKIDSYGIYRLDRENLTDESKSVFLSNVGSDYEVVHHRTAFGLIDAMMETQDGAHYESAGVLRDGAVVFGCADLSLGFRIGDDEHRMYLACMTSHDCSYSWQVRLCDTRIVCNNTLDAALAENTRTNPFKVRHTKSAHTRIQQAHEALAAVKESTKSTQEKLAFLAGRKVTKESYDDIMSRVFPVDEKKKEVSTRSKNTIASITARYAWNDGDAFPEQRGTAYGALNAITGYVDWERGSTKNGETMSQRDRSEVATFGSGRNMKNEAFAAIMEVAQTMPAMTGKATAVQYAVATPTSLLDSIIDATAR